MEDDDGFGNSTGSFGGGGVGGSAGGVWGEGGGGDRSSGVFGGGGGILGSQLPSTQGAGGSGSCGGGTAGGAGWWANGQGVFGEGSNPGGALKGAIVWCARLSMAISQDPATARRLAQYFEKVKEE